ncbi:MAG TPA: permease, partial [Candidatus Krumholzibacteria bacterium]|nr:permease [Candidatus Krumholzibacteria bacterium]
MQGRELKILGITLTVFAVFYWLPLGSSRFDTAILESLQLAKWYAREHVILCLVPAFFIAGGIAVFLNQASVMRYLGPTANRVLAYGVAAVSGSILAVCSCTVLPLFAGIHKRGAGLGPATAFLYSGPAINVLAIILTARVLGWQLGLARAVGAVSFSVLVGLAMSVIFREAPQSSRGLTAGVVAEDNPRSSWRTVSWLVAMVGILVFANWGKPQTDHGAWAVIHENRWWIVGVFGIALLATLSKGFSREELGGWVGESWGFAKQILPLLLLGVLAAGLLLGRPGGGQGLIPDSWVQRSVGGEGFFPTLFASVAGAFMYFATLTEIPILEGLLRSGMGNGPA